MSPRIRQLLPNAPAEQLFLVGGEDMRPFYPQAGHDPEHDKKFPMAYQIGHAAIDEMSFGGEFPLPVVEIPIRVDHIANRVKSHIANAGRIEADRRRLAIEFRNMVIRQTVALRG